MSSLSSGFWCKVPLLVFWFELLHPTSSQVPLQLWQSTWRYLCFSPFWLSRIWSCLQHFGFWALLYITQIETFDILTMWQLTSHFRMNTLKAADTNPETKNLAPGLCCFAWFLVRQGMWNLFKWSANKARDKIESLWLFAVNSYYTCLKARSLGWIYIYIVWSLPMLQAFLRCRFGALRPRTTLSRELSQDLMWILALPLQLWLVGLASASRIWQDSGTNLSWLVAIFHDELYHSRLNQSTAKNNRVSWNFSSRDWKTWSRI